MASPAQLVQAISDATGVPHPTIVDIDRRLAKAGLRSLGGRGFNAARVTALDAARLLTALLGSPQANASVEAVERYARTRVDAEKSSLTLYAATDIGELTALPVRHSFVDALVALITSVATGALSQLAIAPTTGSIPKIEIYALAQMQRGSIRVSALPGGHVANVIYSPLPVPMKAKSGKAKPPDHSGNAGPTGDLEQSRKITDRTIFHIAELLNAEAQDGRAQR